ncbi:ATPase family gene 2 protein [Aspergillus udagawae]|uniref:AAA+-type ATPase n=1 Tax=Aspergillus udagawae TaxID=91492 RepID=A0A8H3SGA3_9EURO|nr:AAA+-type ATPase [Aspergillus udagawae]GFF53118.1 ATPase family gene 2 protein [Aspergillus udagawae]GFF59632.1 ATPase family gene 2 protein [Aspergillus udagawae]GFF98220.1 ATPase family gene 2 protein [Aspergillus udagawae]GIC94743.1 AAA+-type ATPase [Aspergillus udagawae]
MSDARLFTVRPLSKQARSDHKDAFRIYLSSSSLAGLKLRAGDICSVNTPGGNPKTAVAWTAAENIQSTVVQTSRTFQDCYEIKVGEKVSINRAEDLLEEIDRVYFTESSDVDRLTRYGGPIPPKEKDHWAFALGFPLSRCELVAVGLTFDLELIGQRRSFKVANIKTATRNPANTLFRFTDRSQIEIGDEFDGVPEEVPSAIQVKPSGLGGLSRQVDSINESLADFNLVQKFRMPSFYEHSRGILLYGPKGTGKSALLHQIQAAGWKKTFSLGSSMFSRNIGDAEAKVRNVFQEAVRCQPSAIIIDQLDFIAPKRASLESQSLTSVLCECLDLIKSALVLVVAATRHPNDVDDTLRTPHRLAIEIEMQVPTAQDRAEILRAICGSSSRQLSEELIDMIAEKTHGYVGADLFALLQLVCRKARQRQSCQSHSPTRPCDVTSTPHIVAGVEHIEKNMAVDLDIEELDVMSALQETRPTAMREVFLETPKVRWTDIGGQHDIKRRLQKAVERPLKFPERMKRLNVNSKKGILLYGPPGCSKTLTVKALATEAGLNFLAVKGAEILSMYVGESERALREIFRKARSARPSIIFFDEIDAIASRRNSSHGGVNVLTTLLNEMDGIEELKNVLVIAATNKPDVIDPALMRPGRLDNILYIGLPDFEARKEILHIWFRKSVVHPEVDLEELAKETDGYSGAEIVSICETAGDAALDEEEETGQEQEVKWKHFTYALQQVERQITHDVLKEYKQWGGSAKSKP